MGNLKILLLLFCAAILRVAFSSNTPAFKEYILKRRPQIMGKLLPLEVISPQRKRVQTKIVFYHNLLRSKVRPTAGNMLKMKWHEGATEAAQKWANQCQFLVHDSPIGRRVGDYGPCGQNIFVSTKKVPWLFVIESWWLEKHKFVYGEKNNLTQTGHYSQLVWAASHELGCGLAKCPRHENYFLLPPLQNSVFYNYVCNYCPIGNRPKRLTTPYMIGPPCFYCKDNCSDKLCLNSCPHGNLWANCEFLHHTHPHWLCHTKTSQGKKRRANCKATCDCKYEIHD